MRHQGWPGGSKRSAPDEHIFLNKPDVARWDKQNCAIGRALCQPLLCRGRGWGRPPWRPRAWHQPLLHRRGWVMPPWRPRALRRPLLHMSGWGRPPWRPRALHQPLLCRGGWGMPPWRPRARRQPLLHRRGWVMPPWGNFQALKDMYNIRIVSQLQAVNW